MWDWANLERHLAEAPEGVTVDFDTIDVAVGLGLGGFGEPDSPALHAGLAALVAAEVAAGVLAGPLMPPLSALLLVAVPPATIALFHRFEAHPTRSLLRLRRETLTIGRTPYPREAVRNVGVVQRGYGRGKPYLLARVYGRWRRWKLADEEVEGAAWLAMLLDILSQIPLENRGTDDEIPPGIRALLGR